MSNAILLQDLTPEQLSNLITNSIKSQLQNFSKELISQEENNDLLTREETCNFLKIDSSTLWSWTNKGKVKAYGIGNRRYYKKFELLESLTLVKKNNP